MMLDIEANRLDYQKQKEEREKRILAYAEAIQKSTLESTSQVIHELVEERHRLGMTQQDVADITGILPSNIDRLEGGGRVPTLVMMQKFNLGADFLRRRNDYIRNVNLDDVNTVVKKYFSADNLRFFELRGLTEMETEKDNGKDRK